MGKGVKKPKDPPANASAISDAAKYIGQLSKVPLWTGQAKPQETDQLRMKQFSAVPVAITGGIAPEKRPDAQHRVP
jgi:hypothetical protein